MNVKISNGFSTLLFLIFLTLKLCDIIQWSWWWVFSPFWIPLGIAGLFLLIALVLSLGLPSVKKPKSAK